MMLMVVVVMMMAMVMEVGACTGAVRATNR